MSSVLRADFYWDQKPGYLAAAAASILTIIIIFFYLSLVSPPNLWECLQLS